MATIVTRSGKGSALTIAELDANFNNLNTGKLEETPTRASLRPTLMLDLAKTKTLDPRFSFTRASVGTYTDSAGLLRVAPANTPRFDHSPTTGESLGLLIEEQRTNLQIYSEDFTNAAYRMTGLTPLAGQSTAPNGQNTANLITGGGVGTPNFDIYPTDYGLNLNSIETFSLYVKQPATNAAPTIQLDLASTGSVFDTATGAITNASGGGPSVGATATRVGNGWWRFTVTTIKTNQFHYWAVRLPASSSASLLIWGAQLEVGSFPTSYVPSTQTFTGRTSTGTFIGSNGLIQTASSGVARMQYNPTNLNAQPFLLLEAAATNLLTYSEQFDNVSVWGRDSSTINANATTAPDGTTTADKVVSTNVTAQIGVNGSFTATVASYTASFFVKPAEVRYVQILWSGGTSTSYANFDLLTGTVTASSGGTTAITAQANGFYRIALTSALTTAGGFGVFLWMIPNGTSGRAATYAGNGTDGFFVWGAQLEAGSFPTSYIPTVATTVIRSADTSTSAQTTRAVDLPTAPITPWFNISQGSWYVESTAINSTAGATGTQIAVSAGFTYGAGNGMLLRYNGTTAVGFGGNNSEVTRTPNAVGTLNRIGASYQGVNASLVVNGGSAGTLTNLDFTGGNSTTLLIGALRTDGVQQGTLRLRKLAYFPKRLTDAELQAITTP